MKLEFEVKRGFAILKVIDQVNLRDLEVLRAGLAKMAKENSGREPLLLDLTPAKPELPVKVRLKELQILALNLNLEMYIVSEDQSIGHFKQLQEATQLLISGAPLTSLREHILTGILKDVTDRRARLLKQADALKEKHVVVDRLPDENRHLGELLAAMEKHAWSLVDELGDKRPDPRDPALSAVEKEFVNFMANEHMNVSEFLK